MRRKDKEVTQEFEPLLKFLKTTLRGKIEKVIVSKRLSGSPSALVSASFGYTPTMERVLKAQPLTENRGQNLPIMQPKRILEINPRHPIVKELKRLVEANEEDATALDISLLMYDTAALSSGWTLQQPVEFSQRVIKMMNLGLNLDADATATAEEEPVEEPHIETDAKEKDEL